VSAAAVPFRPHRGAYVIVERPTGREVGDAWVRWHHEVHVPAVLGVDGVAGLCAFAARAELGVGADQGDRFGLASWDPGHGLVTVVYLDDDVIATAARLAPLVGERWGTGAVAPRLAGPFRSPVAFEAWPAEP